MNTATVIGSTGSVGTQTLDVIGRCGGKIESLSCYDNIGLLSEQIRLFHPRTVAVFDPLTGRKLQKRFKSLKIFQGEKGVVNLVNDCRSRTIVLSMSGEDAIRPFLSSLRLHKNLVLVNKEAILCHAEKVAEVFKQSRSRIIPADSELSAIYRCLEAHASRSRPLSGFCRIDISDVEKVILPCSGGPFFRKKRRDLGKMTLNQVLRHPTWKMGEKISVDSATLVNKGLEVLLIHLLFGVPLEKIEVVIHPECVLHGMVVFRDGTISTVLHPPDMRIPLACALREFDCLQGSTSYLPHFSKTQLSRVCQRIKFFPVDHETFPAIQRAYEAGRRGFKTIAEFCRKNNEATQAFLEGKMNFFELLSMNDR